MQIFGERISSASRCNYSNCQLKFTDLTMQDIRKAHQMFYSKPNKTNQDEIILRFTKISPVKRNRSRHNCFKKNETIKYYLPKRLQNKSLKNIRVCKEMFLSTFQVGKRRVEGVCKRFFSSGECPQEGRGGDVRSAEYADRKRKPATDSVSLRTF